jgi:DNA polymerase III epsilon subunit-like protein
MSSRPPFSSSRAHEKPLLFASLCSEFEPNLFERDHSRYGRRPDVAPSLCHHEEAMLIAKAAEPSAGEFRRIDATRKQGVVDVYISADIETDGPIPGSYSMLSFALVEIGRSDGSRLARATQPRSFYRELRPIGTSFEAEALAVNGLDRAALLQTGLDPLIAMNEARDFIRDVAEDGTPVLVAYPLSFDWMFLYWYFVTFGGSSPFNHSRCFDLKTAFAVKGHRTIASSGRDQLPASLQPGLKHTHHALEDAREQAEIFVRLFDWDGRDELG